MSTMSTYTIKFWSYSRSRWEKSANYPNKYTAAEAVTLLDALRMSVGGSQFEYRAFDSDDLMVTYAVLCRLRGAVASAVASAAATAVAPAVTAESVFANRWALVTDKTVTVPVDDPMFSSKADAEAALANIKRYTLFAIANELRAREVRLDQQPVYRVIN